MIIFGNPVGSVLRHLDPRTRVFGTLAFALVVCFSRHPASLATALVAALFLSALARPEPRHLRRVLLALNGILLLLALSLALAVPGDPLVTWSGLALSRAGMFRGIVILVRANAVVIVTTSLLGTMEPVYLGWALERLGVPLAFAQILLFMVRYTEVIHVEYHRLRDAMALRCFHPRCDRHTLRSLGYLIGLLLVRSIDRSERILDAMKCRGFTGKLFLLQDFRYARPDLVFAVFAGLLLGGIVLLEVV